MYLPSWLYPLTPGGCRVEYLAYFNVQSMNPADVTLTSQQAHGILAVQLFSWSARIHSTVHLIKTSASKESKEIGSLNSISQVLLRTIPLP